MVSNWLKNPQILNIIGVCGRLHLKERNYGGINLKNSFRFENKAGIYDLIRVFNSDYDLMLEGLKTTTQEYHPLVQESHLSLLEKMKNLEENDDFYSIPELNHEDILFILKGLKKISQKRYDRAESLAYELNNEFVGDFSEFIGFDW